MSKVPQTGPKNQFLNQVKKQYAQYKKFYEQDRSIFGESGRMSVKRQKERRTKSKSLGKKKGYFGTLRKSLRVRGNGDGENEGKFQEIEKEPLWHGKRRKNYSTPTKISKDILMKQSSEKHKIKSTNPVYQFYSECSLEQPSRQETSSRSQLRYHLNDNQIKQILAELADSQQSNEDILQGWIPTKLESSLLAIQKLIDEYFIFKVSMRGRKVTKLSDIIMYVRDVNGYFFNTDVLNGIIGINPKLYKIISINKQRYIQCRKLTEKCIEKRLLSSKIKMKNKVFNQELIEIGK